MNRRYLDSWLKDADRYKMSKENINKLNEILLDIFKKKEYRKFSNSTIVSLNNLDGITTNQYERLASDPLERDPNFLEGKNTEGIYVDSVVFCSFGITQFYNFLKHIPISSQKKNQYFKLRPYLNAENNKSELFGKFINIDHTVKHIPTNYLPSGQVAKLIDCIVPKTNSYRNYQDIVEFYFIGDSNTFIGFLMNCGTLIIRWPIINGLLKSYGKARVKKTIKSMMNRLDSLYSFLEFKDMTFLKDSITNSLAKKYPYIVNTSVEHENFLKERINDILNETMMSSTDTETFKVIITDLLTGFRDQSTKLAKDSFNSGLEFNSKLALMGWQLVHNPKHYNLSTNSFWWEITLDLKCDMCIKNSIHYKIPEKLQKWVVKKMFVSDKGDVRIDGKHPNVSGGSVCLEDLSGKVDMKKPYEELKETLELISGTLKKINFDSAYNSDGVEAIVKANNVLEAYGTGKKKVTKVSMSKIRVLGSCVAKPVEEEGLEQGPEIDISANNIELGTEEVIEELTPNELNLPDIRELISCLNDIDRQPDVKHLSSSIIKEANDHLIYEPTDSSFGFVVGAITGDVRRGYRLFYRKNRTTKFRVITQTQFLKLVLYCKLVRGQDANYIWDGIFNREPSKKVFSFGGVYNTSTSNEGFFIRDSPTTTTYISDWASTATTGGSGMSTAIDLTATSGM